MMYPETNFNYDNNNENKGNRKQRRQNKSRRNLHKAAAVLAGVAVIGGSFWGGSLLTQNTEKYRSGSIHNEFFQRMRQHLMLWHLPY